MNPYDNPPQGMKAGKKRGWRVPAPSPQSRKVEAIAAENQELKTMLAALHERLAAIEAAQPAEPLKRKGKAK